MDNVSFLRLDSSMNVVDRFNTVNLFNSDPSIDLLLLTTHIGGLGLNLTGADTVIFVEHDWNPSKDLQAMDRAHRIGQKKVVNVYRLITRNTIEEKIMKFVFYFLLIFFHNSCFSLQRFKTNLADTVLAADSNSSSLLNLDRETNLIDLISLGDEAKGQSLITDNSSKKLNNNKKQTLKSILDTFSEQVDNDDDCYSDQYDVNKFVQQH
jgi:TATA-binding protein-associated factor